MIDHLAVSLCAAFLTHPSRVSYAFSAPRTMIPTPATPLREWFTNTYRPVYLAMRHREPRRQYDQSARITFSMHVRPRRSFVRIPLADLTNLDLAAVRDKLVERRGGQISREPDPW